MILPPARAVLFALAAVLITAGPSRAALNAYLHLKGQAQGEIKGGVTQKGREGKIAVISVEHGIKAPFDAATGVSTAKRAQRPLVITKELDMSSPKLWNALAHNETLTEVELQFFAPKLAAATGTGAEVQTFTIKLTNARIAGIEFKMPNNKHPDLMKLSEYEEVSFTYQKIEWTWVQGGITASDTWGAQK